MQEFNTIRGALYAAGYTIYVYLIGLDYKSFFVLIALMMLDVIIAVVFSLAHGEFITKTMKKGLATKIAILLLLMALVLLQITLDDYNIKAPFSNIVASLLSLMELMSILETFAKNNVILPERIVKWFKIEGSALLKGTNDDDIK